MKKATKRILPLLLATLMIFSVMSAISLTTASAADKYVCVSENKAVKWDAHLRPEKAPDADWPYFVGNPADLTKPNGLNGGRVTNWLNFSIIINLGDVTKFDKLFLNLWDNWRINIDVYGSNNPDVWTHDDGKGDFAVGSWTHFSSFANAKALTENASNPWTDGPKPITELLDTVEEYQYILVEFKEGCPAYIFQVSAIDAPVSIDVSGTFKTDYIEGENFAKSGMVVKATYMSGDVITLSAADYSIVPSVISLDTEKVSVVYGSFMQEVAITSVTPKAATGIRAEQKEDVDIYTGDTLSEDNITVYATFTNGKEEEITEYEVDPDIFEEDGETEVTITAMGFDTKITVDVLKLEIEDIEITELPRTEYVAGMTFNPEGMVVSIIYNSGRKKATDDYDYDLKDELTEEDTLLTVTLKDTDFTATIELTYVEDAVAELEITELPEANLSYFAGQSFNLQGATIKAIYISGEIVDLDWDDEEITFDPEVLTVDTEEVTVTYKDASVTITGITVEEKVLKEIKVKELPALVEYTVGDSLDVTGMVVVAIYEDSDEEFAITNYVVTPATFETAGEEVEVTITFGEKSDTFVVKVSVAAEEKLKGDVNGDGSVTITDAIAIFRHLADKVKITDADVEWAADVDGNGKIEILDAINIFRYLADKMTLDELQALYLNNVEVTVPGEDDEEEEETPVETIPEEIV